MTVINTNIKSLVAQNALGKNNRALETAMQQLSTGKRINSAKDDAAGLAISSRMTSQIQGLDQSVRNANDGISLLQTTEGALEEVTNMLQRMRELAIQASNDTYAQQDRQYLDQEFQALKTEINRIATMTEWNGKSVLSHNSSNRSGRFEFQVGTRADQTIVVDIPDFSMSSTISSALNSARAVDRQTFDLTGSWNNAVVNMSDGNAQYSVTLPANLNTRYSDFNVDPTEAAQYIAALVVSSGSAISDRYNFSAYGDRITVEPSASNASPVALRITIDRNGTQAEISQNVHWADGTISTGVTAGNLDSIDPTNPDPAASSGGQMQVIHASNIATTDDAKAAIASLDEALTRVNAGRATMGAVINRLTYAGDNLSNVSQNTSDSRSRILDADYAKASTELARAQIMQQASTAVLAQANMSLETVLKLLQ